MGAQKMKIIGFREFLALPDPVIFSEIGTGGLYLRGSSNETVPAMDDDFFQTVIVPPTMAEDLDPIGTLSRWGACDVHARFCVFELADLTEMSKFLSGPSAGV
jgi:hypothetical protein